jgi:hypothetical protein
MLIIIQLVYINGLITNTYALIFRTRLNYYKQTDDRFIPTTEST